LVVVGLNWPTRLAAGRDVSSIAMIGGPLFVLGIASAIGMRFAIYALALTCALTGLWLSIGSVLQVPFPWLLFNLAMAVVLMAPAAALARQRRRSS
jgi:hypothetical protein